jgi:hypothetical protein
MSNAARRVVPRNQRWTAGGNDFQNDEMFEMNERRPRDIGGQPLPDYREELSFGACIPYY